jgi:uncharacterized membrane protein
MDHEHIKKLVAASALAALTCVATLVIRIPAGDGYVNLGDCVVLLSAFLLGPAYGAAAAGIGSFLADILSGYAFYAPGTLVIKSLMALAAGAICCALGRRGLGFAASHVPAAAAAEAIMIFGYCAYSALILGSGWGALASLPANLAQGALGAAGGLALASALGRAGVRGAGSLAI